MEQEPTVNDRELGLCDGDRKVFKIDLTTTNDGSGTWWRLFRYNKTTKKWVRVGLGPDPDGATPTYNDNTRYVRRVCVDYAAYAFVMRDTNGQKPNYSGFFKGAKIFEKENDFNGRKLHYFTYPDENSSSGGSNSGSSASTPPPTRPPSPQPTPVPTRQPSPKPSPKPIDPNIGGRLADCKVEERLFTIGIKADDYGKEISWVLSKGGNTVLENSRTYDNFETDTVDACISAGAYKLTMKDSYGDGIRNPGYYKVYIDGVLQFQGGKNYKSKTHEFAFGSQDMTERDQQWLDSHNTRREKWCVLISLLDLYFSSSKPFLNALILFGKS